MENTLIRPAPCPQCGAQMLWTQNACDADASSNAAYRCVNGHVLDPAGTRQCPACGMHDTEVVGSAQEAQQVAQRNPQGLAPDRSPFWPWREECDPGTVWTP
jgi:predicted RNA-binding Zn-ribbon protein involved in translation (DUF1610 family)